MPLVPFDSLPPSARIWVFAAEPALHGATADHLLASVDAYLAGWKAHGSPLRAARAWQDDRFLIIGVDPTAEQASGCSIDGMFRALQQVEREVGARLVGGGRVFFRDPAGRVAMVPREDLDARIEAGDIGPETPIFDTTLTSLEAWQSAFERPAAQSRNVIGDLRPA
jgi:hypothetical protein